MMNNIIQEDLKIICSSNLDWEKFKKKTVLITGAYGTLASYLVFTLLHLNEVYPSLKIKVIALGRDDKKARKRFADFLSSPLLTIMRGDVAEKIKIKGEVHYIIHAASSASSQFYGIDPVGVISPNVFGTKNLLELAREKKSKGFLFFSSGEVCGNIDKKIITVEDSG